MCEGSLQEAFVEMATKSFLISNNCLFFWGA
jgi:hypothetical protein